MTTVLLIFAVIFAFAVRGSIKAGHWPRVGFYALASLTCCIVGTGFAVARQMAEVVSTCAS